MSKEINAQKYIHHLPLPSEVNNGYLESHLNIDSLPDQYQKTYQYIQRDAKAIGFLVHDKIILKLYHMLRATELLPQNLQDTLSEFIEAEIDVGNVDIKQGAGFAILSQGFLSINIWGRGNVLFSQTYTIEGSFPNLSRKTLECTGVACTWEVQIMQYEYAAWHEYLNSKMELADKQQYLQQFISGDLSPEKPLRKKD